MTIDTSDMIEVSDADLRTLIKTAYALSAPQGLGFLHAREGDLDDETVTEIIERERADGYIAASMDYVHGRGCKFTVFRDVATGKLYIRDKWFDHSQADLSELLKQCGVPEPASLSE